MDKIVKVMSDGIEELERIKQHFQIERAKGVILKNTSDMLLSRKEIGYVYGVIINQLCLDLNNDTEEIRIELLYVMKDLELNISFDMKKYINDSSKRYESSISMRNNVIRLSTKIHNQFDKSKGFFSKIKVQCTLGNFRHILELKEYLKIENNGE